MNDRELEQRLRAWYRDVVGEHETAPTELRQLLAAIPADAPIPLRRGARRRPWPLLAVAATLVVGGALAALAGSGLLRLTPVVPPSPPVAKLNTAEPSGTPPATPRPTSAARSGDLIAFVKGVQKKTTCVFNRPSCPTARLWLVGTDGTGAHEVFPDGTGSQDVEAWTPDGSGLLYLDGQTRYLTDPNGDQPREIDLGCVPATPTDPAGCFGDSGVAFSRDGRQIVFVRDSTDENGNGSTAIATMDLASGAVHLLTSTSPGGGGQPGWSPDGSQIVFSRYGTKSDGGPNPRIRDAIFIVDADGQDLHQVSPTDMDAIGAAWSPDGQTIAFLSPAPEGDGNLYAIRPDGSNLRQLTTDGGMSSPAWTPEGRLLFSRATGGTQGWWTMAADGTDATLLVAASSLGPDLFGPSPGHPVLQSLGGPAIPPPPWTPSTATAVGPAAATPEPTATPELANGFSWGGSTAIDQGGPLTGTATLLADGRVLLPAGCGKTAAVFDPATGTSTPTGSLTVPRGGGTATLLRDGRVLFAGGYNCAPAGLDGIWRSAELYDPATGTFTPTGPMRKPREFQTATLLADGRVLVAGGYTANEPPAAGAVILASVRTVESTSSILASAEVYDPATGTFSKTGPMTTFRDDHTATLLKDGRVLVVGGGGEAYASSTSADLYDPATGTFTKTGSMKTGRYLHTATLLQDGRVLVAGGRSPRDSTYRRAELYDPGSGTFSPTGPMHEGRQQQTATLLPDGRVLVAGGFWQDGQQGHDLSSTELYDPSTGTFSKAGSMGTPRSGHWAMLLADGRVLILGGGSIGNDGGVPDTSVVVYQP